MQLGAATLPQSQICFRLKRHKPAVLSAARRVVSFHANLTHLCKVWCTASVAVCVACLGGMPTGWQSPMAQTDTAAAGIRRGAAACSSAHRRLTRSASSPHSASHSAISRCTILTSCSAVGRCSTFWVRQVPISLTTLSTSPRSSVPSYCCIHCLSTRSVSRPASSCCCSLCCPLSHCTAAYLHSHTPTASLPATTHHTCLYIAMSEDSRASTSAAV